MGESDMEEGYEDDIEDNFGMSEQGEEEYVEDDVSSIVDSDGEDIP